MDEESWSLLSKVLHLAVRFECVTMVKFLLWLGARVNYRDSRKKTALHWACENDRPTSVQTIINLLLSSGADVNAKSTRGRTPLHEACARSNLCVVDTLIWQGAKSTVVDECGTTPLHELLTHCCYDSLHYGLNVLLRNKGTLGNFPRADEDLRLMVNTLDYNGYAVLHLASMRNHEEIVRFLLRMGAKVGVKNLEGMTALHSAAMACAGDAVHVLVDNGEDVNAKDVNGNTPLHLACSYNYFKDNYYSRVTSSRTKMIQNLLSRGALVNDKNGCMKTPYGELEECYSYGNPTLEVKIEIEETFMKHVVMLETLNLQDGLHFKWILGRPYYDKVKNECCIELEDMKSITIFKHISLLDVLSHTIRPSLLSPDDLPKVAESVLRLDLFKRFPLYGSLLRNFFQRTTELVLFDKGTFGCRDKPTVADR